MTKLLCPKCQLPIEDHDGGCPKRLSRRFFLGALGSAFGAAALAKIAPNVVMADISNESPLILARTKVHDGGYIVLDGGASEASAAEYLAAKTGRPVIERQDWKIIRVIEYEQAIALSGLNLEADARTENPLELVPPNWPILPWSSGPRPAPVEAHRYSRD